MAKVSMKRATLGGYWLPYDDDDLQALEGVDEFIFKLKKNAQPRQRKRYFAFITLAFKAQKRFAVKDAFRHHLQMAAGQFKLARDAETRQEYCYPIKIVWEELKPDIFKRLLTKVINAFLQLYGETLDPELVDQITRF